MNLGLFSFFFFFLSPCVNQRREICKLLSTSRAARCEFGDYRTCCSQAGKEELYITNSYLAASDLVEYRLRKSSRGKQHMALKSGTMSHIQSVGHPRHMNLETGQAWKRVTL